MRRQIAAISASAPILHRFPHQNLVGNMGSMAEYEEYGRRIGRVPPAGGDITTDACTRSLMSPRGSPKSPPAPMVARCRRRVRSGRHGRHGTHGRVMGRARASVGPPERERLRWRTRSPGGAAPTGGSWHQAAMFDRIRCGRECPVSEHRGPAPCGMPPLIVGGAGSARRLSDGEGIAPHWPDRPAAPPPAPVRIRPDRPTHPHAGSLLRLAAVHLGEGP